MLKGPLEPYFWKPPNDNQKHSRYVREFGKWRKLLDNLVVNNVQVTRQENLVTVIFEMKLLTIGAVIHSGTG